MGADYFEDFCPKVLEWVEIQRKIISFCLRLRWRIGCGVIGGSQSTEAMKRSVGYFRLFGKAAVAVGVYLCG